MAGSGKFTSPADAVLSALEIKDRPVTSAVNSF